MLVNEALPLIAPLFLVSQPPVLVCLYPERLKPFVLPATCHLTISYLLSPLSLRITGTFTSFFTCGFINQLTIIMSAVFAVTEKGTAVTQDIHRPLI